MCEEILVRQLWEISLKTSRIVPEGILETISGAILEGILWLKSEQ